MKAYALFFSLSLLGGCSSSDSGATGVDDSGTSGETSTDDTGTPTDDAADATADTGTGGDTTTSDTGADDTGTAMDSTSTDTGKSDAATDSDKTDSASDSPADTAPAMVSLTVKNYLSWCTVKVNGGASSTAASFTVMVPSGSVVHLAGDTAGASFAWGYWRGTAGDTTAAHDTAKMTTVTMSGNKTVQACCPLTAGGMPCPAP